MQNKTRKLLSCFTIMLCVLVSSFSMSFESSANGNLGNVFYLNYAEPSCNDEQGYIVLLLRYKPTGEIVTQTFLWTVHAYNEAGTVRNANAALEVMDSYLKFGVDGSVGIYGVSLVISNYNQVGRFQYITTSTTGWIWQDSNYQILSFKVNGSGSIRATNIDNNVNLFTVYFAEDGSSLLLRDIISQLSYMQNIDNSIWTTVNNILNSIDEVESQLSALTTYLRSSLSSMDSKLSSLLDKADRLIEEQEESNTWLEKIWTSIQRLFKGDNAEDDTKVEEFGNSTESQSNKVNELNQQNKTEKVNVDKASSDIDANIDGQAIANYGTILSVFTGNTHILQYILIVLAVALISYVLFGKR